MKNIHLGFVGFRHGHIFSLYELAQKKPEITVVGCCEEEPNSKEQAMEKGVVMTHTTFAELINDPQVDAVAVGACYGDRGGLVIQALKAGKHVIADKPLCTSLEELEEIKKLSKEKQLAVCLMLDLRDNPNVITARKLIKDGVIGKVNNIYFNGQHPLLYGSRPAWYFEKGKHGGVINDLAIHGIDLVRLFTDSDVEQVLSARSWNFYANEEPAFLDSAQFMLKMQNGAGVIADVSYSSPNSHGYTVPNYWRFEVAGEKGALVFNFSQTGVRAYIQGETEEKIIPTVPCEKDYLDSFIEDICSGGTNTAEYLKSTEQTLWAQQQAR